MACVGIVLADMKPVANLKNNVNCLKVNLACVKFHFIYCSRVCKGLSVSISDLQGRNFFAINTTIL